MPSCINHIINCASSMHHYHDLSFPALNNSFLIEDFKCYLCTEHAQDSLAHHIILWNLTSQNFCDLKIIINFDMTLLLHSRPLYVPLAENPSFKVPENSVRFPTPVSPSNDFSA